MAKVQFNVDSGANIHSNNTSGWMDTVEDLGLEVGEWEDMDDDDKYVFLQDWAYQHMDLYYEEK